MSSDIACNWYMGKITGQFAADRLFEFTTHDWLDGDSSQGFCRKLEVHPKEKAAAEKAFEQQLHVIFFVNGDTVNDLQQAVSILEETTK